METKRSPTGSDTTTNTIGMERVSPRRAAVTGVVRDRMRSGALATSSFSLRRIRLRSPFDQRTSVSRLPPSVQPRWRSSSPNAATCACAAASSTNGISRAMRFAADCWARAAKGAPASAPITPTAKRRRSKGTSLGRRLCLVHLLVGRRHVEGAVAHRHDAHLLHVDREREERRRAGRLFFLLLEKAHGAGDREIRRRRWRLRLLL